MRKPLLIFDGDCGFCRGWALYWQALTGKKIDAKPFQAVGHVPGVKADELAQQVHFIDTDKTVYRGAAAAFATLGLYSQKKIWWWLYRFFPGFAPLAEWGYRLISRHRGWFGRLSRWLWGRDFRPPTFSFIRWLFLKILALAYFCAFVSLGVQVIGLMGAEGILPVGSYLDTLLRQLGPAAWGQMPTLLWFNDSDIMLRLLCWGGALSSVLVFFGISQRFFLGVNFVLYLSLMYGGQDFLSFQWDTFLLEVGFMGFLLTFHTRGVIWLFRWFVFRFLLSAGLVKIYSADPTWANWTALEYHFLTQPLPNVLSVYMHHLPAWLLKLGVGFTFLAQIVLPWLIWTPRRLRFIAGWACIGLELFIFATGNYTFFNVLSIGLCLFLFDDQALERVLPRKLWAWLRHWFDPKWDHHETNQMTKIVVHATAVLLFILGVAELEQRFVGLPIPDSLRSVQTTLQPWRLVNNYGLFAVMTTERNEIILEGSDDGETWQAYEFRYKPGDLARPPLWNVPHQPRLDWQMWFASLGSWERNPWLQRLALEILQGNRTMDQFFVANPFPEKPPRFLRGSFYEYEFSTADERKVTGHWWKRTEKGMYFGPVELQ